MEEDRDKKVNIYFKFKIINYYRSYLVRPNNTIFVYFFLKKIKPFIVSLRLKYICKGMQSV